MKGLIESYKQVFGLTDEISNSVVILRICFFALLFLLVGISVANVVW